MPETSPATEGWPKVGRELADEHGKVVQNLPSAANAARKTA